MSRSPDPASPRHAHTLSEVIGMLWPGSHPSSRDVNAEVERTSTYGDRLADRISVLGGSWTFIVSFLLFLVAWAVLNTKVLGPRSAAFDPYPYVFLNLLLSMLASLQAPIILMSQGRQAVRDRIAAANDYEVNVRAELAIRTLHAQVDRLRAQDLEHLLALQEQQLALLRQMMQQPPTEGAS